MVLSSNPVLKHLDRLGPGQKLCVDRVCSMKTIKMTKIFRGNWRLQNFREIKLCPIIHRVLISEVYPTSTVRKMEITEILSHSGKYRNLFSYFFGKNFVKPTFLRKRWFDEIFFWWVNFSFHHTTVWKLRKFTLTHLISWK